LNRVDKENRPLGCASLNPFYQTFDHIMEERTQPSLHIHLVRRGLRFKTAGTLSLLKVFVEPAKRLPGLQDS
jgi:hypothetical protein